MLLSGTSEAQAKEYILKQLKAFKSHNEIDGLSKHIYDLERDGYVSALRDERGDLIAVRITPRGKAFLDNGGYSAIRQTPSKAFTRFKTFRKEFCSLVMAVIAGLIIAYLSKKLGWI